MHYRTGSQIREDFLRFFESKNHRRVHSSSLVPHNDPTLLFTNAGMNQFKDVFLGADRRPYTRAATSQKCVRAGGKHNDLENVGFTRRHHTFFEMLGNFSFGDYFKREAIAYAWELLTSDADHCFAIDPTRLYVTIFEGDQSAAGSHPVPRDDEAEQFWIKTGVPKDRIFEMSAKDNFWQMGETGPCGPCSEIFYDLGIEASEHTNPDGTKQDKPFPEDDQRYVEIWNLVFIQFDRIITPVGPVLMPLDTPNIDTGMGLERIACVLQGVLSNYQTDLFTPLIQRAAELTNLTPEADTHKSSGAPSLPAVPSSVRMGTQEGPNLEALQVRRLDAESSQDQGPKARHMTAWAEGPGTIQAEEQRAESPTHTPATTPGAPSSPTVPSSAKVGSSDAATFNSTQAALSDAKHHASLRIIADHARAATFLIADGVRPENEGRGYVLRKILRRAIRHGRNLGQEKPFMHQMVYAVRDEMQTAYPELTEAADRISKTVLAEEEQFARSLVLGFQHYNYEVGSSQDRAWKAALERLVEESKAAPRSLMRVGETQPFLNAHVSFDDIPELFADRDSRFIFFSTYRSVTEPNQVREGSVPHYLLQRLMLREASEAMYLLALFFDEELAKQKLAGERAFHIFETYGLPLDFMVETARDSGIGFDHDGFERAKAEEQARARSSWKGGSQKSANPLYTELPKTEFEGYSALRLDGARVLALTKDGTGTQTLAPGEEGEVILDATSFYADSGGQQGDIGHLLGPDHHTVVAEVRGATKPVQGVFAHKVLALQPIALGDELDTAVDPANRHATERNHTGTHLLHAALRQVLGTHVKQAGSLNNATRLRFDFSHFAPVADAELQEIEDIVNREVLANAHVETLVDVPIDEAVRDLGAMALFGEKYGDRVRVVRIATFSTELCGGTHTRATGEIGLLKLTGESSVSSGIRRIEALSGANSLAAFRRDHAVAAVATHLTGGAPQNGMDPAEALTQKIAAQDEELKKLRRELDQARMKSAAASTAEAAPIDVKGIKFLAQRVTGLDKAQMRTLVDTLRTKLGSGVVLLGSITEDNKVSLIAGVTKDLTASVHAGKLISTLAPLVGGKGGGRPDLAEAGGTTPGTLDSTLAQSPAILANLLD